MIEKSDRFKSELKVIVEFIAIDSISRALDFYDIIISKVNKVPENPYIYRQKDSAIDNKTRELIFKGYTIPFDIDDNNNKIIILGIFNQNIWE